MDAGNFDWQGKMVNGGWTGREEMTWEVPSHELWNLDRHGLDWHVIEMEYDSGWCDYIAGLGSRGVLRTSFPLVMRLNFRLSIVGIFLQRCTED